MMFSRVFVLLLFAFISLIAYGAEEETKTSTQYQRYEHGVIGNPEDAAKRMVLDFEDNREMKPAGNIVHVEGTDEYLGKGIDEIKGRMLKLESKFTEMERRMKAIEGKFKGSK